MEEPLEQEHSMTNDDLKPSSSSTTTKSSSSRSIKQTTNGTTRRHKRRRRRQTNSTRSSSEHSTSSSRSSSTSSISNHSSQSSMKTHQTNETETKKTRSCLAQEQLQTIIDKTKTGKYEILDSFSFLTFENDDDWKIAFEHFKQQQLQQSYTTKKSYSLNVKKNGSIQDHHIDGHALNRSISMPCKIEESNRVNHSSSASIDEPSVWQNHSPNKSERQSLTTIKTEPKDRSNRTTSEHDENHFDNHEHKAHSTISSQKSTDDMKSDPNERKHHHHHHHHKSHKRHKTNHDLSINGDGGTKHPTITSMSDLAKQQIKHESMSIPPPFNFPTQFDSRLFSLPSYSPFAVPHPPPPPPPHGFSGSFDPSLMLASRLYGGQYPRDIPMPPPPIPPPRPPSRSLQNPYSLKENHSMEKMFEKFYPGIFPGYLAAASAGAAASTNSTSPVSSMNIKMHGASPNGPDHPLWSHRDALQRQFSSSSVKSTSMKSPLFDSTSKLSPNHSTSSPTDNHHHHHHRRHSSSTSNTDLPNPTTPTGPPLYLAPVIVTEFHQHQHNHNHTHEHKLNITTKNDRSVSPPSRSKTPLSNEPKKPKTGFSVTDMFNEKTTPIIKHSPSSQSQGFLSVVSNKKDNNSSSASASSLTPSSIPLKKPSNGKWSTAHIHIAWMIYHHDQRQRAKQNPLNPTNKIRPSPTHTLPSQSSSSSSNQSTFLPPPLPLIDNNDLSLLRPPIPPSPLFSSFSFDITSPQNNLFRPTSTTKLPRPAVTPSIKTPTVKREQKTPLFDERMRHTSPSPLSRSTSGSNFLPSSPSQRMRMDYPSLLLPPPQHHLPSFSLNDDRKRFMPTNNDFLPPFGPTPATSSPFLSSFFPMSGSSMPPPSLSIPSSPSSSSRRSGINSDLSKTSLFPPPSSSSQYDFTRSPLMPPPLGTPGLSLPNNHLESDRYRFLLEQQARERDLQFALMAAASGSGPPPPSPFFTDPNSSALFKHF